MHSDLLQMNAMRARFYVNEPINVNGNDESTGIIWNAIQSTDFKNNITPVLKITNNNYSNKNTSNASNITVDKLYILSPSEMGMPIMRNYYNIYSYNEYQRNANMHYYDLDSYNNTIKSSGDGNNHYWFTALDYIYAGDAYQWWMLPAGSRKMNNGNQAYHNTDSYSYCALSPSDNNASKCNYDDSYYWLRSVKYYYFACYKSTYFSGYLIDYGANDSAGVVVSFSF